MTVQCPDYLLHRGRTLYLHACPLASYLDRLPRRMRPEFAEISTACWRGYVALWEIEDGMLWLRDVRAKLLVDGTAVDANLGNFLPHRKGAIAATWFSGEMRCPEGRLRSIGMRGIGQGDSERTRVLDITKGRLVREWLMYNPPAPLIYMIDAEGRRTHHEAIAPWHGWLPEPDATPDPFPGDAQVEPWRLWGNPEHDLLPADDDWNLPPDWADSRAS